MDSSPGPGDFTPFEGGIITRQSDPRAYSEISAVADKFRKIRTAPLRLLTRERAGSI